MTPNQTTPRKWDAEIITARQHDAWIQFETDIHQSAAIRARVARALDRYGLGTSDIAVEEALDYLTNKELGQSARYFNTSGKAQFNQQQITHAVLSYMSRKEQQRHMTDLPIVEDDTDDDDTPGSMRASQIHDADHIPPDEAAARRDALRAIACMVPASERELYNIMLSLGEPGSTLDRVHRYAARHGIGRSTVYFRIKKLADAIKQHPLFPEIAAPFAAQFATA